MATHPLWTGADAAGITWSLRSDATLWVYSATAGTWTQDTTIAHMLQVLWYAVGQGSAAVALAPGYALAACESSTPPPPPPPQTT